MNSSKLTATVTELIRKQLLLNNITLHVSSNSMKPLIQYGDQLIIKSATCRDLLPGDIVVYDRCVNYCTHRFICGYNIGTDAKLITKGDHFKHFDLPVDADAVLGKVTHILKHNHVINLQSRYHQMLQRFFGGLLSFQWRVLNRKQIKNVGNYSQYFAILKTQIVHSFHLINYLFSYSLFTLSHLIKSEYFKREKINITVHKYRTY
ncbi:MAG: signal peptidase I [bacterium]